MYGARFFGDNKYFLDDWYMTRRDAEEVAAKIRTMGNKARIVPTSRKHFGTHYLVYYHIPGYRD